jgi:outer membrane lipoprotein SlyB
MLIEVVPRPAGPGGGAMDSSMGSSGAAGATGSSAMPDRVYRVTLRMDDGSTRIVTQESTPDFRSGDRVNLTGGMLQH